MEEYQQSSQKVIRISKKKLVFLVVLVIVVLGGWLFFRTSFYRGGIAIQEGVSVSSFSASGVSDKALLRESYPYPYPSPIRPDVTDTREFLKTNYSAEIYTRDVPEMVENVEDAVHRVDGRVDSMSSSEKFGRVSFVIPKSELSEFRDEIEELTHRKLYTESISSQNLLGQKQKIEQRTEDVVKSLEELEQEKGDLDSSHSQRLGSIQTQINALQNQLNTVRADKGDLDEDDEDYSQELSDIENQEDSLADKIASLQKERTNENREYTRRNNELVTSINDKGGDLELLAEEDTDFMDNIETVNGYVNVSWINLWNLVGKFSPTPMWVNAVILVLLVLWYLKRREILPKVEVV